MKIFLFVVTLFCFQISTAKTIHKEQSLYRNIVVTQVKNKRCMKFSLRKDRKQNQSCKYINKPEVLVFDYAKLSVAGILATENPQSILIIGLGGGTLVEAFHTLAPEAIITSVEIDTAVIKVAKNYFDLPTESWHKIIDKDGRIFIKREKIKNKKYDIVILDAFNGDYIPEHLMTVEFLKEVKSILSDKGLVIANTFSSSKLKQLEGATYHAAFGDFYLLKGQHSGNRIILASNKALDSVSTLKNRAEKYRLDFDKMDIKLDYLWQALNTEPEVDKQSRILTDDYAPVNILKN